MATNICSSMAPSNEVAKQGLTDMYLPTLKLREARSPTYWAIAESNHQSNINLLPKPSPREYRPKAVDYNSPFGSGPYIARPAASGVVNLVPLQSFEPSNKPFCPTSGDIPNISINAIESLDITCDNCLPASNFGDNLCCPNPEREDQKYDKNFGTGNEYNQAPAGQQPGHWPRIEMGDMPSGQARSASDNLAGLCCPGMFGRTQDEANAASNNLLEVISGSQDVNYNRQPNDRATAGDRGMSNAPYVTTLDEGRLPSGADKNQLPGGWQDRTNADRLDYDTSIELVSSPTSDMYTGPQNSRPSQTQPPQSGSHYQPNKPQGPPHSGSSYPPHSQDRQPPSTLPSIHEGTRKPVDPYATENQSTVAPFAPPPTQGPSNTTWDDAPNRPAPPSHQPLASWNQRDHEPTSWNQRDQDPYQMDPTTSAPKDWLENPRTLDNKPSSAFCQGLIPTATDTGDKEDPRILRQYESPEGVVGSAHVGPGTRGYKPLCGGSDQQPPNSTWTLDMPEHMEQAGGPAFGGTQSLVPDQSGPIVETGAVTAPSTAGGCCEAEFVKTEVADRRVSEPTNRIIQALSPRGLCGGPPATRILPHIQHYDVVQ